MTTRFTPYVADADDPIRFVAADSLASAPAQTDWIEIVDAYEVSLYGAATAVTALLEFTPANSLGPQAADVVLLDTITGAPNAGIARRAYTEVGIGWMRVRLAGGGLTGTPLKVQITGHTWGTAPRASALNALTIPGGSSFTLGAAPGTVIAAITGLTAGSRVIVEDPRLAVSGSNLVVGPAPDFVAGPIAARLIETLPGAPNSPLVSSVSVAATAVAVAPVLALTGSPPAPQVGVAYSFTPSRANGTAPFVFALTGSLPAGLSFSTSTGAISGTPTAVGTTSGLNIAVTDSLAATASLGVFSLVVGAAAATVPAAPTLTATPGNGQVSLAWTDGSTGGAAITAHKLYAGASAGALTLQGTISTASPYVDTGLTNGTARYYALSAVNSVGEGAQSSVVNATPVAPAQILIPASSRNMLPTGTVSSGSAGGRNSMIYHRNNTGVTLTGLRVQCFNAYFDSAMTLTTTGSLNTVSATVEYPIGSGTRYPMLFGGATTYTFDAVTTFTRGDANTNFQLPANAACLVHFWESVPAGGKLISGAGSMLSAFGEGSNFGSIASQPDKTQSGAPTAGNANTSVPVWLLGSAPSGTEAALVGGDSIDAGNNEHNAFTSDANGNIGAANRWLGGVKALNTINIARPTTKGSDFATKDVSVLTGSWLAGLTFSRKWGGWGRNDYAVSATGATIKASVEACLAKLPSTTKTYVRNLPPTSTSTDSWATTANQSNANTAQDAERVNYGAYVSAKTIAGQTDAFDLATSCTATNGSGQNVWVANGSTDGVHPTGPVNAAAVTANP